MLVTGDVEDEKNEGKIRDALIGGLRDARLYPVDVYIVGHHGSKTSSSKELLDLIKPTYAIISSNSPDRQYHHPDLVVMERLANIGAKVFATYKSGDITITFKEPGIILSPPDGEALTPENYLDAA